MIIAPVSPLHSCQVCQEAEVSELSVGYLLLSELFDVAEVVYHFLVDCGRVGVEGAEARSVV